MSIVALKRRKPKFRRQRGPWSKKGIKNAWRRPRGENSKQRKKWWGKGEHPGSGWRQPRSIRGLHPSGLPEVLVHNPGELDGLSSGVVVRIARTVGRRKRMLILEKAKELGIKVINP